MSDHPPGPAPPIGMDPDRLAVPVDRNALRAFCARWDVSAFSLFGSILRDDFGPDSDVDVLVDFHEDARHTLRDLATMKGELETIFSRSVDLFTRRGLQSSRNPVRREAILSAAVLLDVA